MAYNSKNYDCWTPSKGILTAKQHSYDGTKNGESDSLATIKGAGYFNQLASEGRLRINDLFYIIGSDGREFVAVTAVTPNVTLSGDFNFTVDDGAITTDKLADLSVTTAKLDDSSVSTLKLADNSVTSAKIAGGTITSSDISENTILGSKTVALSGNNPNFGIQGIQWFSVGAAGGGTANISAQTNFAAIYALFLIRGAGTVGDTAVIRNDTTGNNITDVVDISAAVQNDLIMSSQLIVANRTILAGNSIQLLVTDGGGGDAPAVEAFLFAVNTA